MVVGAWLSGAGDFLAVRLLPSCLRGLCAPCFWPLCLDLPIKLVWVLLARDVGFWPLRLMGCADAGDEPSLVRVALVVGFPYNACVPLLPNVPTPPVSLPAALAVPRSIMRGSLALVVAGALVEMQLAARCADEGFVEVRASVLVRAAAGGLVPLYCARFAPGVVLEPSEVHEIVSMAVEVAHDMLSVAL